MATNSRGPKASTTKRPAVRTKAPAKARSGASTLDRVAKTVEGYTGNAVKTVRDRPYTAMAFLAGTAAAAAFLWAKRALIGEQAAVVRGKVSEQAGIAREKIGDLREQASEQAGVLREEASEKAKAFRGKLNERFVASEEAKDIDPEGEVRALSGQMTPKKTQSDIAAEALSLKQVGVTDPLLNEQSKVGAVAY